MNKKLKIATTAALAAMMAFSGTMVTGQAAPVAGVGILSSGVLKTVGPRKSTAEGTGTSAGVSAFIRSAMESAGVMERMTAASDDGIEAAQVLDTYRVGAPVEPVVSSTEVTEDPGAATLAAADISGEAGTVALAAAKEVITEEVEASITGGADEVEDELEEEIELLDSATVEEAEQTGNYGNMCVAQVNDYVNVRKEPNESAEILGKLYDKSVGAVLEETEDGWYRISSGDVDGYVKSDYVVVGDVALLKKVCRDVATVNTETLYIHAQPSTYSEVLDQLPRDDDLTIIDFGFQDIGWLGVTSEGGDGYISTEFVDISVEFVKAESKEAEAARLKKEAEARAKAGRAAVSSGKASAASVSAGGAGSSVVGYAMQFVGNPYVYGGSSLTNGTDCSGFVMSVYAAFGVSLPHSSAGDRSVGYGVDPSQAQPGDIVCYSGHVGIYAGNGQLVHASTPSTGIKVSSWDYKPILAVRRIF